jgi:hypothetical protein
MAATSAAFKCGSGTAPAYLALLFVHVGGDEELIRTVIGSNRIEALPIRLTDRDFADCDTVNAALDGQLDLVSPAAGSVTHSGRSVIGRDGRCYEPVTDSLRRS